MFLVMKLGGGSGLWVPTRAGALPSGALDQQPALPKCNKPQFHVCRVFSKTWSCRARP